MTEIIQGRIDLLKRIDGFMAAVNDLRSKSNLEAGNSYHEPLRIRAGRVGGDWVAIDKVDGGSGSVYCFVRMTDGQTRTLGSLKAGDIHKPASYKAPAKHARASVLDADYGFSCATMYGIQYLR